MKIYLLAIAFITLFFFVLSSKNTADIDPSKYFDVQVKLVKKSDFYPVFGQGGMSSMIYRILPASKKPDFSEYREIKRKLSGDLQKLLAPYFNSAGLVYEYPIKDGSTAIYQNEYIAIVNLTD